MEQPAAVEPAALAMEEPLVTEPTLPRGGAHDEGDPGDEELWSAAVTLADPVGAEAGATGDAPSNAAWDPTTVAKQATTLVASTVEVRLGRPIRAQQQPRRHLYRRLLWKLKKL